MKLYATLETSTGKVVSVSDNSQIIATVYDKNLKAYSVIIDWCNIGDIEKPTMGALVSTREWRNQPDDRRKVIHKYCKGCQQRTFDASGFKDGLCDKCWDKKQN